LPPVGVWKIEKAVWAKPRFSFLRLPFDFDLALVLLISRLATLRHFKPDHRSLNQKSGSAPVVLMKSHEEGAVAESLSSKIGKLISAASAQTPEERGAAFWDSMLCQVKGAILRECWLHIRSPVNPMRRSAPCLQGVPVCWNKI
jgi:hypothetical protein